MKLYVSHYKLGHDGQLDDKGMGSISYSNDVMGQLTLEMRDEKSDSMILTRTISGQITFERQGENDVACSEPEQNSKGASIHLALSFQEHNLDVWQRICSSSRAWWRYPTQGLRQVRDAHLSAGCYGACNRGWFCDGACKGYFKNEWQVVGVQAADAHYRELARLRDNGGAHGMRAGALTRCDERVPHLPLQHHV